MKRSIGYMTIALMAFLPGMPRQALAQNEVPQALSSAGPALATSGSTTFLAWKGKNTTDAVWYSTLNGSVWSAQKKISSSQTTAAPALAVSNGTTYMAMKGQAQPSDNIYLGSWNGSTFPAPSKLTITGGDQTTAAPALAGSGANLYLAWTTTTNAIMYATYTGSSWSAAANTGFSTNTQTGPALAVYNGTLFLAWVEIGSNQVEYATLPLTGGVWSPANTVASAQTSTAPALGVFAAPATPPGGLYVAWTTAAGQLSYSEYNGGSVAWNPPVPIPPGPLATTFAPALISFAPAACPAGEVGGSTYIFAIFYTATNTDIYYDDLLSNQVAPCKPPLCHGTTCY